MEKLTARLGFCGSLWFLTKAADIDTTGKGDKSALAELIDVPDTLASGDEKWT
ncbi:MAG: hypothetical protein N3E45_07455 [Oscillatoriaceae bacterium SKW80]|nr:hypothetical protein [Oscillatoriaceae bacterium SKYG93]MCX8120652.1 hypothetical protein [Oscillatoriaceae bacterium SKW80]MDW8453810.1 hypothetical protein [Oscillatoriaceae cyanobacterium SKYGB_i_bin93]HIK27040.1 hypothetical protein [Oscillatoriaceae cyanobacterium M7585_C2015_266]